MRNLVALLILLLALAGPAGAEEWPPEQIAFFESKVRPVLAGHCYGCHSVAAQQQGKLKAGLFLDSRQGLLEGGESGPALVPGKPEESIIIKVLRHQIKDAEMPPKGALPGAVIADIAGWIAMGAPDPRVGAVAAAQPKRVIDTEAGKDWWAFKRLAKPVPPAVKRNEWVTTPVDAFILAKQEAAGLSPNEPASRETLLRRVTFDLTGLPPTPEERDAFLQDTRPDAYARLVDRLLESPHYGERWGRHWLDVVRFAESSGYEFDAFRPGAYHYRDWVIDAFNKGLPYDEFVRMQIAGDRLKPGEYEGASAAGFLVAGPYPGQITAKTKEKIRYDQLDDMVATIGNGLLGVSMNCARCHDHKYDPLPQRDYYGMAAALATTVHSAGKIDLAYLETRRKLAAHDQVGAVLAKSLGTYEREELPGRFEAWKASGFPGAQGTEPWQIFDVQSAAAESARLMADRDGHVIYLGNKTKDDLYTVKVITYRKGLRAFRLDALSEASLPNKGPGLSDNGNFVLGDVRITAKPLDAKDKRAPVNLVLGAGPVSFEQKGYEFARAIDSNPRTGWGVAPRMGMDHAGIFLIQGEPAGFEGGTEFTVHLRFSGFHGLGKVRLAFTDRAETRLEDPAALQNAAELRGLAAAKAPLSPAWLRWFSRLDDRGRELTEAVVRHDRKRPQPVLTEVYTVANGGEDVYFLRRGEVDRKEGKAETNFIQVLMRSGDSRETWVAEPAGKPLDPRVALANWITDVEAGGGPLLARVMANRLWHQHFGRGIVATPNDFGSQGERPTHPELLEWLAARLVEDGWKLKPLHRQILLSATYRQAAGVNGQNGGKDPENKLWAERPSRRLEAEAIRDSLLQLGGRLDPKMHGPSETDVASPRRSVYLRVKRSELVPFLTMFDAPEPTMSIGERGNTTVPTQALALLNSPFVRDMADRFSARLGQGTPQELITRAGVLAFCRQPTGEELQRLTAFHERQKQLIGNTPEAGREALREVCLAMLCLNEFIYVD
ncbi:MAG: DUF1549 domain-containing protein [Verrucomicrobia bacterium]|nr:DUF1549 domain-containing protein [Verrucomicrobiota bacterium]